MCTVTIVRAGDLLRVACNRDELRQRPQAHAPFVTRIGRHLVLAPQDPQGGGTWIAANSAGLVFALLNAHPSSAGAPPKARSRGLIIPMLAGCDSLDDVRQQLDDVPSDTFAPCRVLVAADDDVIEIGLGLGHRTIAAYGVSRPLLFTSSSLGDALVEGPRRLLFEQMLCAPGRSVERQDAFHAHRWRDRPAVSVHVSRPEAATVSTTVVEATSREMRMIYAPTHCDAGTPVGLIIDRQQIGDDAHPRRPRREHAAV
jgi:hypothetical protein